MAFVWKSPLVIAPFDFDELVEAIKDGIIPRGQDLTQPWCVLVEPLSLMSDQLGPQTIPAGFIYNQASLPAAVRWWMSPSDPRICKAACWHDYLSPWGKEPPPVFDVFGKKISLNSTGAAEELYYGMRASGANWFDAAACSRAVKTFGPKF